MPEINGMKSETFLRGKTIIIIDDSTIRGNNSKRAVEILKQAGVGKIYLLNYTPKIGLIGEDGVERGCLYGVDMPPEDNFIVRNKEENRNQDDNVINEQIGAEVKFLSIEGMFKAFEKAGLERDHLCSFCIGGEKPF
jgi:amidophosphoribosyltransferase